ncbi:hypothetical protein COW82_00775 [Candidatus Campbellbacteria bacterium CG22_combo_CG10-13_8_21_14_all_43_18]|uniref:Uncharacterized protein n=1 Tax=Candidatus Campbellbacteria bacterium CG22_combo_CG10-13_8_21_14_all_43_18 TaxID=1974530 RepID=A0A2H0DWY0_9BACT|nr:MAG: hypothetical protein COW82_00775 [Candidatus Campbellbacteria bacterium CG22_combo_CG10-13_8_21_14_all_43_18]
MFNLISAYIVILSENLEYSYILLLLAAVYYLSFRTAGKKALSYFQKSKETVWNAVKIFFIYSAMYGFLSYLVWTLSLVIAEETQGSESVPTAVLVGGILFRPLFIILGLSGFIILAVRMNKLRKKHRLSEENQASLDNEKKEDDGTGWKKFRVIAKRTLFVIVGIYILLLMARLPSRSKEMKSQEIIDFINSQELAMEDVTGENLPPEPDPALADATIEGIDENDNWIRDDVEIEIFKRYSDDAVIRSAMLQYAMGMQLYLTQVFNSETWKAAVIQEGRGSGCVFDTSPDTSLDKNTDEEIRIAVNIAFDRQKEVENLVFNTKKRNDRALEISKKYTTSYGPDNNVEDCDIDPSTLSST